MNEEVKMDIKEDSDLSDLVSGCITILIFGIGFYAIGKSRGMNKMPKLLGICDKTVYDDKGNIATQCVMKFYDNKVTRSMFR